MIETERLILRQWKETDAAPFIEMGLDKDVMRFFPKLLSATESINLIQRASALIDEKGWGFWALELKENHEFIGFIGLHDQPEQFDFSPCIEIGWRLATKHWKKGYATEGAKAALDYAFNVLNKDKVVSFTATVNKPSQAVMERLGMCKVKHFNHPKLPDGHALQEHVLYEINNPNFGL
ncbi:MULTISPECIES: GNAT family N-acetyltransferase [Acinetobacter]|jgi:RimJ/RimL family protein N-acetyltransferase|uniref:GNAT family N-acetyltransferase n=1 Tax=Acinetobacter TaxID=469 RepID=UPI000451F091|nr:MULTISPECIES: GNAT family N-acetyltransferase [Acinetobacter]MDQ9823976.1 GNAT family N-acetyltransferase [Acinetobacter sp. 163]EHU1210042.1 GNAT family N-acetyltransferase [Acinetobacter nosocomialis]EXH10903.1 acetyltransferase family protein [Acinetobacter sp. 1245593]EXR28394.1 acetyltransferase family protein [Acinetobacter sp. 1281984]MBM9558929.1 GNAT family N-acetyltransferase [Acinetobacter nosocomialis]